MQFVDNILRRWQREPFPQTGAGDLFVRDTASTSGLLTWIVLASVPALLVGLMSHPSGVKTALMAYVQALSVALLVSLLIHVAFALARDRAVDSAWFAHAWLFVLLAPHELSLLLVASGLAFGVVIGSLIFGGSGRNLVSPPLLGIVFLQLGYPASFAPADAGSAWRAVVTTDTPPVDWVSAFMAHDAASLGAVSPAACLFGALVLYAVGAVSLRVILGALLGAALASVLFRFGADGSLPGALLPHWHWILGSFAFCTAFILTDPSAQAVTRSGRWLYGGLAGFLAVTLRVMNPENPEGTFAAFLFAALFAPLIDQVCRRVVMWKWRRRRA